MISGTVYGVVLNGRAERAALHEAFAAPPYKTPPHAPVLYIKPRGCIASDGAKVHLSPGLAEVEAAATVGLLFDRDVHRVSRQSALAHVAAACLALDVTEPHHSYYRPAVRQRCRDGFLPIGAPTTFHQGILDADIVTSVNGREVHRWTLADLVRDAAMLISDISSFMTLAAGDLLLVGLPSGAPRVGAGDIALVRMQGLAPLHASFEAETVE